MSGINDLQKEIVEWSTKTFGDRQTSAIPVCNHLLKEVNELKESISRLDGYKEEFADCFILLIEVANTLEISGDDLIELARQKMEKNKKRKWGQPDENGVIEHIEGD